MVVDSLILHLHPSKVPATTLRWTYTWILGGLSAVLLTLLIFTGIILLNNYTPAVPYDELFKTIARGRYATAMPAWSEDEGGPLSDYQISELVALIQSGDWNATGDRVVNLSLTPLIPFTTEPDAALLEAVGALPDGAALQSAIGIYAGSCVACHGADGPGTALAPALNAPSVREKTAEELTRTLTFGVPGTLMAGWSNQLTPEQMSAMVTLLQRWDEIPAGAIPAPNVPIPTTAESIALGGDLYAANCVRCHGPEGQGTPRAPALNVKSFLTDTNDQAIELIITGGVPGTAMPAWGDRMTAADIQAIVGFIRQWEPTAPEVAVPTRPGGGGPPWLRNNSNPSSQPLAPNSAGQTGIAPQAQPGPGQGHAGGNGNQPWSQSAAPEPVLWQTLNADPQGFRNAVQHGLPLEQPGGYGPGNPPEATPGRGGGHNQNPTQSPGSGQGESNRP